MTEAGSNWIKFYRKINYFHRQINHLASQLIPINASVLEIGSKGGEILNSLDNVRKIGMEEDKDFYNLARRQFPKTKIVNKWAGLSSKKFDYILLTHSLSTSADVQKLIHRLKKHCHSKTRIVVFYFNFFWKPVLDLAEKLNLKRSETIQPNWLSTSDVHNLFYLESFNEVSSGKNILSPINLGQMSTFLNKFISQLPGFSSLDLINYSVYAPLPSIRNYSVSVIIPARNEAGNMKGILDKLPFLGRKMEVIFIEGGSRDDTYFAIKKEISNYHGLLTCRLIKQKGQGKGDAVRLGFSQAVNELLVILDADLTVDPQELPKFYNALATGKGEFVMGSRLVYPMEKLAMRNLNFLGNKFFSLAFSFLLGQKIKDTLCGTKAILREDYRKIERNRHLFGNFDPFGDFDLIFGAAKLNLRILEIPIRYKQRSYGKTNISRFQHGLLLLQMTIFAARRIKFI